MISATVTPGTTILPTTPLTPSDANALGTPTLAFSGTLSTAEIAAGAVTAAKTTPGAYFYGTTSNSGNDYTLTLSPALASLTDGAEIAFKVNASNTGAATLNVNALGVKAVRKLNDAAVAAADLRANAVYVARYNTAWNGGAGAWQVLSATGGGTSGNLWGGTSTGAANSPAIAVSPAPVALADLAGVPVAFKVNATNTGAVTLTVTLADASTPNAAIRKNGEQALTTGDITANAVVTVIYNGTYFILQSPPAPALYYGADAGANDDYVVNPVPAYAGSAYYTGMVVAFKANTANTGAATLNVSSIGAATIKKAVSSDLNDSDIRAGQWVTVVYDGTNWQMQGPAIVKSTVTGSVPAAASSATTLAHGISGTPQMVRVVLRCVTGELNYVTGDEVAIESFTNGSGYVPWAVTTDGTNVIVRRTSLGAALYTGNKTTYAWAAMTPGNWELKAYCQHQS